MGEQPGRPHRSLVARRKPFVLDLHVHVRTMSRALAGESCLSSEQLPRAEATPRALAIARDRVGQHAGRLAHRRSADYLIPSSLSRQSLSLHLSLAKQTQPSLRQISPHSLFFSRWSLRSSTRSFVYFLHYTHETNSTVNFVPVSVPIINSQQACNVACPADGIEGTVRAVQHECCIDSR